jgi:hypothetical protein
MGFNTVAVLYNDHTHRFREEGERIGRDIARSMQSYSLRRERPLEVNFGAGVVVSQAHADYSQVVVVGRNSGAPISECHDLDWYALAQCEEALRRHGYTVKKPKKAQAALTRSKSGDA